MENEIIIQIANVTKKFGEQQVLVDNNLMCTKGSITGIVGRNGSGKSVLFKCICGFLRQNSGDICIYGKKNTDFLKGDKQIGAIIEEPAFLSQYNGLRNLELLYLIRNKADKGHLRLIMEKVGLDSNSKKPVGKYSMGMKQRLAIAQAIMEDQEILILDEPMNGLDNAGVESMRILFKELQGQGKTILLASHSKEDIEQLCGYVYEMDLGRMHQIK